MGDAGFPWVTLISVGGVLAGVALGKFLDSSAESKRYKRNELIEVYKQLHVLMEGASLINPNNIRPLLDEEDRKTRDKADELFALVEMIGSAKLVKAFENYMRTASALYADVSQRVKQGEIVYMRQSHGNAIYDKHRESYDGLLEVLRKEIGQDKLSRKRVKSEVMKK